MIAYLRLLYIDRNIYIYILFEFICNYYAYTNGILTHPFTLTMLSEVILSCLLRRFLSS